MSTVRMVKIEVGREPVVIDEVPRQKNTGLLDHWPLAKLQAEIGGGYIQRVQLGKHTDLVVDEDGLGKDLPLNAVASLLARQTIVGTALVLHAPQADDRTLKKSCPARPVDDEENPE